MQLYNYLLFHPVKRSRLSAAPGRHSATSPPSTWMHKLAWWLMKAQGCWLSPASQWHRETGTPFHHLSCGDTGIETPNPKHSPIGRRCTSEASCYSSGFY